ncbi:hypothetical protein L0156_15335 [bacterium]|nr:hypothetical protein [bacterium]
MIPAYTFTELVAHAGHQIQISASGEPANHVAIRCTTCNVTIVESNAEEKRPHAAEIIAVVEGGLLQDVYCTLPAKVTRIDIDHGADELCLVGQFEASAIEEFDLEDDIYPSFAANVVERFGEAELNRLNALTEIEIRERT